MFSCDGASICQGISKASNAWISYTLLYACLSFRSTPFSMKGLESTIFFFGIILYFYSNMAHASTRNYAILSPSPHLSQYSLIELYSSL